jgi:hypothetical protein
MNGRYKRAVFTQSMEKKMPKDMNDSRIRKAYRFPKFSYGSREEFEDYGAGRGRNYQKAETPIIGHDDREWPKAA